MLSARILAGDCCEQGERAFHSPQQMTVDTWTRERTVMVFS